MCLAIEKYLGVCPAKTKRLDTAANLRRRRLQVRIDQDIASRRNDQESRQIPRTDVVEIAGDLERSDWRGPGGRHGATGSVPEAEEQRREEQVPDGVTEVSHEAI